jgi:discoidin domain receptor family protein 2
LTFVFFSLEGTGSCQTPLLTNSKILTSSNTNELDNWCPSPTDIKPYLQVTLSNLTYITQIEIQSNLLSNIDYRLEYTRENIIDQYTIWRSYRLLNNKKEKILLDPPMIAKHVRLNIIQMKQPLCIQFELFGCIFTDGVVSYSMLQGSNQLEDDTYDGQYDEKKRYLYGKKSFMIEKEIFISFFQMA